jgi:hypothetical protein
MTKPKNKSTRITNVQVPGETPAAAPAPETVQPAASIEAAKPEVTMADVGLADAAEQPELANVRKFANSPKRNYRDMHAADIDPATLSAPVLTRDGWLCPLPTEKK